MLHLRSSLAEFRNGMLAVERSAFKLKTAFETNDAQADEVSSQKLEQWDQQLDQLIKTAAQLDYSLKSHSLVKLYDLCVKSHQKLLDLEAEALGLPTDKPSLHEVATPEMYNGHTDSTNRQQASDDSFRTSMPTPPLLVLEVTNGTTMPFTPQRANNNHNVEITRTPTLEDLGLSTTSMALLRKEPFARQVCDLDDDEIDAELENLTTQLNIKSLKNHMYTNPTEVS